MDILGDEQGVDLAIGKCRMPNAGGLADHGQGTARAGFETRSTALGETGLQKISDEVLELDAAQGGLGLELTEERIRQVEGRPHKSI